MKTSTEIVVFLLYAVIALAALFEIVRIGTKEASIDPAPDLGRSAPEPSKLAQYVIDVAAVCAWIFLGCAAAISVSFSLWAAFPRISIGI